jgi:RNA 2',3'-cyclic 3'-phosphodiesterase
MPAGEAHAETLRAFIAVEISEAVAQQAAVIIDRLRATAAADIKWVESHNLHLTLKFLGETRRSDLPRLSEALRGVVAARPAFRMELSGVGAFPNERRPEVIWLGVREGQDALAGLAAATEAACAALGWPREEKPFRVHLTLGRSRQRTHARNRSGSAPPPASADRASLSRALGAARDATGGLTTIDRLVLVQSQLQPGGPVYTILDAFPLQGTA